MRAWDDTQHVLQSLMQTGPRHPPAECLADVHPGPTPQRRPKQAKQGTLAACARHWPPLWGVCCAWSSYKGGVAMKTVAHSTSERP
eukprot:3903887-Amphidinium_carterae.1